MHNLDRLTVCIVPIILIDLAHPASELAANDLDATLTMGES